MIIFVDMDGVLTDFHRAICDLFMIKEEDLLNVWNPRKGEMKPAIRKILNLKITDEEIWSKIDNTPKFWENMYELHWTIGLITMLEERGHEWYVCTSPSRNPNCLQGKMAWLQERFSYTFRNFFITPHKQLLATYNRVLIDDTPAAITKFRSHGGRGILFPRKWNTPDKQECPDPVYLIRSFLDEMEATL